MASAVITVASGGLPVTDVTATAPLRGMAVTEATKGVAVTKVAGGLPVTFVLAGNEWPAGGGGGAAYATWNPADKSNTTLSNGDLTATATTATTGGVRGAVSKTTGKYYFEVTYSGLLLNSGVGVASASANLATLNGTTLLCTFVNVADGSIWVNGSNPATMSAGIGVGDSCCVAVDLVNKRIWYRKNAGVWNAGGGADPATNVGGVDISSVFASAAAYPVVTFPSTGIVYTAKFGASAFAQAVPAGFTSGWPTLEAATEWPSAANRPVWTSGTSTLSWSGPSGGGATGTAVPQSRVLTLRSTQLNSSSIGQVIEGLNITAAVRIRHNNVVLKQCRIAVPEVFLVEADSGLPTGVVVEDCLIDGTFVAGTTGYNPDGGGGGSIIRRCNITGCENGVGIGENNMSIFDCWVHDLYTGGIAHTDGIQGIGGFTALTIRGNAIYSTDTSCIIMGNEAAGYSGLVIDSNLLVINNGSACIVCRGDGGGGTIGTISITNNKMQNILSQSYNDIQLVTGPVTYTGNTDYITGAPIGVGE